MPGSNILLALLGGILVLRLIIWQFFRTTGILFKEDFSDIAVAFLILLLGILWLLVKFINRRSFKKNGLELPIFIFFAAAAGSLFYAPDFSSSLQGVLVLGAEITFFYMLLDLLDTPSRLRSFLIFVFAMTCVVSVYGIKTFFDFWKHPHVILNAALELSNRSLYYLLLHPRAVSFLGWPNILAGYLLLFLPLFIILPFYFKNIRQKAFAMAALFITAVCFLYTLSFLGWLSFFLSTCVLLPFFWEKLGIKTWPKEKRRMLFYGFSGFGLLFLVVLLNKNFLMSLTPRFFYYKTTFVLLEKNPLWGYGWGSFGILSRVLTQNRNNLSSYIHNSYLQIWLETGVIGILAFIFLLVRVFRQARAGIQSRMSGFPTKKFGNDTFIFIAIVWGLLAFFIDNLFSFTLLMPSVALFWWMMLAVFCAVIKVSRPSEQSEESKSTIIKGFFFILVLFMLVILARILGGHMLYYQAMSIKKPGSYSKAIEMLNKAKALDPWSSYLPAGEGSIHMEEYRDTRIKNFLKLAAIDYLEAIHRSPRVYYNYFALGKIDDAMGDTVQGRIFTQKARELSPSEFSLDEKMFNQSNAQHP